MKRLIIALILSLTLLASMAGTALAHNVGHVDTPAGCADVGGGNHPPEGNAVGTEGHARGVHHAAHAGQGTSAVNGGTCS